MYHIRILDKDRQIQAILPDVRWSYTRRLNEATEITIEIPRETVDKCIVPDNPLFGFFAPTQPFAVQAASTSTRPDKARYAEIAAFVQVYDGDKLKASGKITGRNLGETVTIKAMTEEILLESNITPAQYGRVWDGWDLADVARDLLDGWQSIRVKAQSQWQSYMVDSSNVDLTTEPGVVMLAKQADGRYYESGHITLRFDSGEIKDFVRWDRVRWSADSNDVVQTSIQISYDGSNWSQEIDGGLPEEIGYYLGGTQSQVWVRINLSTTDTDSEDPNGNPVGVTPYVFAVELIARTKGQLIEGNIPAVAGVTVKGLDADHANALQVLIDACEQNSWEFSVWNGALSIAEILGTDRTRDFVLRAGTNMEITSLGDDDSELCNVLTAYGPGSGINRLEITRRDEESIAAYGEYALAKEFDVSSLSELEQAAQAYLDSHNTPRTHFSVRAAFDCESEPDYGLGDVVRVVDPDTGIITTTRIMTESREYSASGLSVRLDLGRARLNLQSVLDGRERLPKPVDPLTPTGVYARGVFKGLVVGCSAPKLADWSVTECHISTAKGFVPSPSTLVATGRQTRFDIPNLAPGVRYYARLIHVDTDGRRSEPSREVSAVTQYIRTEDLDQAPPDTPVWDTCEFVREIVLRWHPAARAAEYEIREFDSDWGEAAGQVWRGNATTVTLTPTKRSHTYYIRAISAAGVYSLDAATITLTNDTPSTPPQPTVQEFFSALWITINPVADNDIVSYNLYMTPVDDEGDPTGDTQVTTYLNAGRVTWQATPGTRYRVEVAAADVLGEGSKSAPVYAATNSLAEADIPEGIIGESKLTEELMTEIESAVDGVDYLDGQMSEALQRLSQAESELDSIDGRVTDTETKITELEGEIATKVSQTDYNTLAGRVETAETNIAQNAQAIATKASQSSVDALEGRVSIAESTITQHGNAISSVVSEVESIDGRVKTAESAITQLGSEITLKVQVRKDGKLVIAGIGMAVDEDGQSEVAVLADRFRVLTSVDGEMKSVFAVDTETGKVYVLGDMIATGLIRATEVQAEVAKHLLLAAQVATVDHLGALKIEADKITVGGSAPGIPLMKPEGAKLWHFDGSLVSTDGTAPESGAVATLRPDGRFGGCVAVEEGTENLANNPTFSGAVGTTPSGWHSDVTIQQDDFFGQLINVAELLCVSGNDYEDFGTTIAYPLAYNTTYTISFWARGTMELTYELYTNRGIASATWKSKPPMSLQWQRYEVTIVTASSGSIYPFWWFLYNVNDVNVGKWVRIARIQLEQKPFATSFVDGTRAEGRLRYPQLLDKKRGTLSVWINPHVVVNWNNFFSMNLSTGRFFLYFGADGSSMWDFGPWNSGPGTPAGTIVAGQWTMHTLTWDADAGVYRYYVNGEFVGERQYVEPDSLPSALPTVTNYGALLDELLILPYAATPEQIQAWYAMGAPFHDPQGIVDGASTPVHVDGAGGTLHIDSQGETWTRKSDGKVMFRFDANTGDAEFAGKLGAKIIEAQHFKQVPVTDTYNVMDSFDSSHPLEIPIYIDEGMTIHDVRITARGMRYRAYASGAVATGSHSHDVEIPDHTHQLGSSLQVTNTSSASTNISVGNHSPHEHDFSGSDSVSISISGNTSYAGMPDYHSHSFSGSGSDSVNISGTTSEGGPTYHSVTDPQHRHDFDYLHPYSVTESGGGSIPTTTSGGSHTHNLIYGIFDDTTANGLPRGVDLWFSNSESRSYTKVADLSEPGVGVDEFQLCQGTALPVSGTGWKWVKFTTTTKGRISVHIVIRGFQDSWLPEE